MAARVDILFGKLLASPNDGLPDGEVGGADNPVVACQKGCGGTGDGASQEDHQADFPEKLPGVPLEPVFSRLQLETQTLFHCSPMILTSVSRVNPVISNTRF
jgi:hypothetical protein